MKDYTSIPGAEGLPDRRFPYRADTAADRSRLTTPVAAVCTWAMGVLDALLARIRDDATRDDLQQDALLHLIDRSLPRFDAQNPGGARLETYLFGCLHRSIRMGLRTRRRAQRRDAAAIAEAREASTTSPLDQLIAREVSQQLRAIFERPHQHLEPDEARAILAWLAEQAKPGAQGPKHRQRVRRRMHSTFRRFIAPVLET